MNRYTATVPLPDRDALNHFIDNIGPLVSNVVISVTAEPDMQQDTDTPSAPKPRAVRGSKVNDAILGALKSQPASIKDLKGALEGAGLSPGSLSTGIAALKKTGEIQSVGDGLYALAQAA